MSGNGQPLVFIHGLGSSTRDWEFQVPEFSRSYQVITFDLRGHGRSDKPEEPYHLPMFAADLAGLLSGLGLAAENDPEAYIAATRSMLGWNVTDRIGSIQCPVLVITADQDYTPVAVKEAYVKLLPNAQLVVIPGTHHATPMEQPEKFNAVLMAFLQDPSGRWTQTE